MINLSNIPFITSDQMREVDRTMIEDYGITLIQMMENAGKNLACLAQRLFLNNREDEVILILAGRGGNGGGSLVCARYLQNWGYSVKVCLSKPVESLNVVPLHQFNILQKLGVPVDTFIISATSFTFRSW